MTHITQETAVALAKQSGASAFFESMPTDFVEVVMTASNLQALCEATAKHVIDTLTAGVELPPLPDWDATKLWTTLLAWNETMPGKCEKYADEAEVLINTVLQDYARQALAKQAGEIERLNKELADALDCKLGNGPTALSNVIAERDQLKARLAALEGQEPHKILRHVSGATWLDVTHDYHDESDLRVYLAAGAQPAQPNGDIDLTPRTPEQQAAALKWVGGLRQLAQQDPDYEQS